MHCGKSECTSLQQQNYLVTDEPFIIIIETLKYHFFFTSHNIGIPKSNLEMENSEKWIMGILNALNCSSNLFGNWQVPLFHCWNLTIDNYFLTSYNIDIVTSKFASIIMYKTRS